MLKTSTSSPIHLPGLFITGTDTGVGKTHVACLIARQLSRRGVRIAAYKPVCSGALPRSGPDESALPSIATSVWDDVERLRTATGNKWPVDVICPQRFLAPLAPPIAARLEGRTVDFQQLTAGVSRFQAADLLLIEGAGGWLSPLTETLSVSDLAQEFGVPVLVVARNRLGTINHTLLTIEAIRARGLVIAAVILNENDSDGRDGSDQTNADEIERRGAVPVVGTIHFGSDLDLHRDQLPVTINWQNLATALPRKFFEPTQYLRPGNLK